MGKLRSATRCHHALIRMWRAYRSTDRMNKFDRIEVAVADNFGLTLCALGNDPPVYMKGF